MSPELQALSQDQKPKVPALRIVPHIEGSRSLHFNIIEREVPEDVVIKIGRFTDKAHVPNRVAFKSKVVSRGHAEIWCSEGKFLIKDTKSSSGTFLNHVRLSPPNSESKAFLLNDGDVVQLGVDYQGGTEEIYRCVKMRIELNYSWRRPINQFSLNALKQFKQITQMGNIEGTKQQIVDCCICLGGIGPYQALFLAPCSHVFHYKCIRPTLFSHHSGFLCPLCRSFADLEAAVDNSIDWEQVLAEQEDSSVAGKLQEEVVTQSPNNIVIDNSSADDEEQPFENIEESSTSDKGIQVIVDFINPSSSNLGTSDKGITPTSSSSPPSSSSSPPLTTTTSAAATTATKTPLIPTITTTTNIDTTKATSSSTPP